MPTKARGPLVEDILRHAKAAKRIGAPGIAANIGGTIIVIPFDSAYLEKLAQGQPPAPDADEQAERERRSFTMKDW